MRQQILEKQVAALLEILRKHQHLLSEEDYNMMSDIMVYHAMRRRTDEV